MLSHVDNDSEEVNEVNTQHTSSNKNEWERASTEVMTLVNQMCGVHAPVDILNNFLSVVTVISKTWRLVKKVSFSTNLLRYSELLFKLVFGRDVMYGRQDRRDGVLSIHCGRETYGLLYKVLDLNMRGIPTRFRLLLIQTLPIVSPQIGNQAVVYIYGYKRFSHQLSLEMFAYAVLVKSPGLIQPVIIITDP